MKLLGLAEPKNYRHQFGTAYFLRRNPQSVACKFKRTGRRSFGFELGAYDRSRPLLINPVLVYSAGFGQYSTFPPVGNAIAVDSAGNSYIAGNTQYGPFRTTPGALNTAGGQSFVMKISPAGDVIQYSTYLPCGVSGIAVNAQGSAYIAGETISGVPAAGHRIAKCGLR